MNTYAKLSNTVVTEILTVPNGFTVNDCVHKDLVSHFVPCPSGTVPGSTFENDTWTNPKPIAKVGELAPVEIAKRVSPIVFKLLFTGPERVAIKNSADPLVQDFNDLINDPRLKYVDFGLQSTKDALEHLAMADIITTERITEILLGNVR